MLLLIDVSSLQEISGLRSLIAESSEDKDMVNMATEELGQAMQEESTLQNFLFKSLLPKDDADERDSILEVRAGEGYLISFIFIIFFSIVLCIPFRELTKVKNF